jgi:signal peptidase II
MTKMTCSLSVSLFVQSITKKNISHQRHIVKSINFAVSNRKGMKYAKYYLLTIVVILIDQTVKLLVHSYMFQGVNGEIPLIGDWCKLHYTLNPGMAFGLRLGEEYGKLFLTLFRLLSMIAISVYLYFLARTKAHTGFVWCIAAILGGAIGNVIDSTLYGVLLDNAEQSMENALFFPVFYGQVIDMFYLDLWKGYLPEDVPFIGGEYYAFWPIFNVADSAIFIGVALILIRQKAFLAHQNQIEQQQKLIQEVIEQENTTDNSNTESIKKEIEN